MPRRDGGRTYLEGIEWWAAGNRAAELVALKSQGLSAAEIARRLGTTKNSVISKLRSLRQPHQYLIDRLNRDIKEAEAIINSPKWAAAKDLLDKIFMPRGCTDSWRMRIQKAAIKAKQ